MLGGARGTNEDAYAWARLAKGVIGTDNVDAQIGDGLPGRGRARPAARRDRRLRPRGRDRAARPRPRRRAAGAAPARAPGGGRARRAARRPRRRSRTGCRRTRRSSRARCPARRSARPALDADRAAPRATGPARSSSCSAAASLADVGRRRRRAPRARSRDVADVRFLSALRRGNVHGALDAGLAPGFLPGRVSLDAGREWFTRRGAARARDERGLDARRASSRAAADGKIEVLVLLGADPVADFPDADLARRGDRRRRARDRGRRVPHRTSTRRADVVPAVHALGREDRQRHQPRRPRAARRPQGRARGHRDGRLAHRGRARAPPRRRLRPRDRRRGHRRDRTRRARARRCRLPTLLRRARDGVVLPLREHRDEIVLRTRELSILADDGSGTSWDPIKVEGWRPPSSRARPPTAPASPPRGRRGRRAPEPTRRARRARALGLGRQRRRTPRFRARDAYALRLVVGRHALRQRTHGQRDAACSQRVRRPVPLRVNPHDAGRPRRRVRRARCRSRRPRGSRVVTIEPDAGVPGRHRAARLLGRRRRRGRADRRRRRRHRPARGDAAMNGALLALDPLFNGDDLVVGARRRAHQGRDRVRAPARVGDALHLGHAQGHRRHAEPHRPEPRRSLRRAADARRRHQAVLQGAVDPRLGRPARVPARAVPVDPARVPDVLRRADRRHGLDPRAPDVPAGRRPPDRRAVHPRDVGHRRVRRDARGLVVGLEVPVARLGARRPRSCSRTKPRSGSRSSACSSRRARSRRTTIVDAAGVDRTRGSFVDATGSGCRRSCRSSSS